MIAAKPRIRVDTRGIPYQREFFRCDDVFKLLLSTGFGGGKTFILIAKMFRLMNINQGCPGGLLCPTYKMYKRDVRPTILEFCAKNRIRYNEFKADGYWYFPDFRATVWIFTAENDGEDIKGPNLAWFLVNEVASCTKNSIKMAIGRVRLKRAKLLQVAMSGTPEGFNWTYEEYIQDTPKDMRVIYGDSRLNKKNVHEVYFENLENEYDELLQEQYIQGRYVNLTGKRCAWAFNRFRHTDQGADRIKKIPGLPVWVALDFNVSPMAATLFNRVPNNKIWDGQRYEHLLRGFAEIKIPGSNTWEACDAIKAELAKDEHGRVVDECIIYPDPAGRARSTKSHQTDFDIIREKGFQDIRYKSVISVKDALNSLNGFIAHGNFVLNSKRCPNAVADLEQVVFKGSSFELDKSNPERTHWLDGIKNMVDYEFGIKRASARVERIR